MQQLTDEQLIKIFQRNEGNKGQVAFSHLYNRYSKLMLNYFYFSLHYDHNKAQDFVQDLFVKILEKHRTFNNDQFFKAWIYRIATNMCSNEYRKNNVIRKYHDHILSSTEIITLNPETENILRKCISDLNTEHRSLIVLRFKLKLSIKEMAQIYECPEGTIKSRLFHATKELSKLFKN
jgi:RNA polymerase sigma-70 factor (ECF subfamily)